jgi:hypothetical protein
MGKYSKFSVSEDRTGKNEGPGVTIGRFDGKVFEGSNDYNCFWMYQTPRNVPGWTKWDQVIYGPHMHKQPEVIYLLGSDPKNPFNLGARIEMHIGPELETHVITKSCLIFIPANLVHGWWVVHEVTRPFIVFDINQSPTHTEKALRELAPVELRKNMLFIDQGYVNDKRLVQWPEEMGREKVSKPGKTPEFSKTGKYDKYIISGLGPGERDSSGKSIAHIDGDTFEDANEYWAHWAFERPLNVGSDPDNPKYLGVDFEAYSGPEMERDPSTDSRISFIPPHFPHGPSTVQKVARPFIFIEINQSPKHTEKGLVEMVPDQKQRDRMMFYDAGYDSPERKITWPKGMGYK